MKESKGVIFPEKEEDLKKTTSGKRV